MNNSQVTRGFVLTLIFFLAAIAHAAPRLGGTVGNGGDGLECRPSPDNDLNGFYSLDYILTRAAAHGADGAAPVDSWKSSSERILRLLRIKVPTLASSFEDFKKLVFNTSYQYTRIWEPTPFGLKSLDDERIVSQLPANCLDANGHALILQTVVRQYESFSGTKPGVYIYKYDPELVAKLDRQSPLQLSHLMVHEWLWDLSLNVDRNRRVNKFFHSTEFESMPPEEVIATLRGMGLEIPEKVMDGFEDQNWQGYPLTEEAFFRRYPNAGTLGNLGQLKFEVRQRDEGCEALGEYCHPEWRNSTFPVFPILENRFYLAPGWGRSDPGYPIRIISPDLLVKDRRMVVPENAQFWCRFISDGEFNLECKLMDPELFSLFRIMDELPFSQWPVVKASITEEGFRMIIPSKLQVDGVGGPDRNGNPSPDSHTMYVRSEIAVTVRYKWRPGTASDADVKKAKRQSGSCDDDLT